jgi:hypothetical protein
MSGASILASREQPIAPRPAGEAIERVGEDRRPGDEQRVAAVELDGSTPRRSRATRRDQAGAIARSSRHRM